MAAQWQVLCLGLGTRMDLTGPINVALSAEMTDFSARHWALRYSQCLRFCWVTPWRLSMHSISCLFGFFLSHELMALQDRWKNFIIISDRMPPCRALFSISWQGRAGRLIT